MLLETLLETLLPGMLDSATPGHLTINGYRTYSSLVSRRNSRLWSGAQSAPGGWIHGSLPNCRGRELNFGVGTSGPVHQSNCELSPQYEGLSASQLLVERDESSDYSQGELITDEPGSVTAQFFGHLLGVIRDCGYNTSVLQLLLQHMRIATHMLPPVRKVVV